MTRGESGTPLPEITLKRCPFCGSEAKIQPMPPINPMARRLTFVGARIGCSNGDCIAYERLMKPYQTFEDAKREWNRRAEQ